MATNAAKANGIARICDELGDLELQLGKLEARRVELRETLLEEARRTKNNRFEGRRFDATVWLFDMEITKWKDCFEVLARQTQASDEQQRKIVKAHTARTQNIGHARAYIPKVGPKRRI